VGVADIRCPSFISRIRSLAKSIRNKKDFYAIIDVLEEGGIITVEKKIPPTGGTPRISRRLAFFNCSLEGAEVGWVVGSSNHKCFR
jgi:hypothetical protein